MEGEDEDEDEEYVIECFDVETGATRWRRSSKTSEGQYEMPEVVSIAFCPPPQHHHHHHQQQQQQQQWQEQLVDGKGEDDSEGLVALGTTDGRVCILRAATGEPVADIAVTPKAEKAAACASSAGLGSGGRHRRHRGGSSSAVAEWVEKVVFSPAGDKVGAAAGRYAVLAAADTGIPEAGPLRIAAGTINGISFDPDSGSLAIGTYGSVQFMGGKRGGGGSGGSGAVVTAKSAAASTTTVAAGGTAHTLEIGAAAVLVVAVSPDGTCLAAGCLDKRIRLFPLPVTGNDRGAAGGGDGGNSEARSAACEEKDAAAAAPAASAATSRMVETLDWVGFDGPVRSLSWSPTGRLLAATPASGPLLVIPPRSLVPGDPPITCVVTRPSQGGLSRGEPRNDDPRFTSAAWCPAAPHEAHGTLLAATSRSGGVFVFDVDSADQCFPRRCFPMLVVVEPALSVPRRRHMMQACVAWGRGAGGGGGGGGGGGSGGGSGDTSSSSSSMAGQVAKKLSAICTPEALQGKRLASPLVPVMLMVARGAEIRAVHVV